MGQFLPDVVGSGAEFSYVVPVHHIDIPVLAGTLRQTAHLTICIGEIRQHQRPAGTEILVGTGFRHGVVHGEIVGHCEPMVGGRNFEERIAVVMVDGEAVGIERGIKSAVTGEKINVADVVTCRAGARGPDGTFAAVGRNVEHPAAGERGFVVTDDPAGVRAVVAVRGPVRYRPRR